MGKSLASTNFKNIAKIISSDRIKNTPKQLKFNPNNNNNNVNLKRSERVDSVKSGVTRYPLAAVVSNCVKRWFNDTLKEANNGDNHMQILVGQMYNSGYGVRQDSDKGRAWISRASKTRSSAWKVGRKQPGYNASDSDSEDLEDARS